jgi:hypothetical protein
VGKDKSQTVTQTLDPATQKYVEQMRNQALGSSNAIKNAGPMMLGPDSRSIQEQMAPFFDPYMQQVIGGLGQQYDRLRGDANVQGAQAATAAGAFNGSRGAIAQGVRLGEIDRAQGQQVGGLLSQGWQNALTQGLNYSEYARALRERQAQEPIFRAQAQQGLLAGGLGPYGTTQKSVQPGSVLGDIGGLGLIGLGLATGGPMGAMAGAKAGGFNPGGFLPTGTGGNTAFGAPYGGAVSPYAMGQNVPGVPSIFNGARFGQGW